MNFRMLFARRKAAAQLDDELRYHLDAQIAENVVSGMSAEEARYAALRSFGNPVLLRDQTRGAWSWAWLDSLVRDMRFATRTLWRAPGFSATVAGTLAVGIGAAAAMFTVVDNVLLQPLPYRDSGRLVLIHEGDRTGKNTWDVPWLDIDEWSRRSRSFEAIGFVRSLMGRNYIEGQSAVTEVAGYAISTNLLDLLRTRPMLGGGFDAEPGSITSTKNVKTVILSYGVWQTAFKGDRNVVGKAAKVNNVEYTIIGVMPRGFFFPSDFMRGGQVWTPLELGNADKERSYDSAGNEVIGRLRKGVSLESAQAEMSTIQNSIASEYTDKELRKEHGDASLERFSDTLMNGDIRRALLTLFAAAGVLWLIASVNATNLLLARATARRREIAMRSALGASRRRVMQQMMIEGLALSATAAILGIGLAFAGIRLAAHAAPARLGIDLKPHLNLSVVAALCALTLLSALISTAWPSMMAVRAPIEPALRQGGMQAGTGRRQHLLRGALVAVEIAMSLTLLVACGLLLRTIYTLRHVPLGYRTDHILVANLGIPAYRYTGKSLPQALYMPLLAEVQRVHGVQAAGLMSEVPLGGTFHITMSLRMNGNGVVAELKPVTPDIQRIFGFRMVSGRYFNNLDTPTSEPVAVVNPAFARMFAPDKHDPSSVIGAKVWNLRPNAPARVIGIVDDTKQLSVAEPAEAEMNLCLCQITPESGIYQPSTVAMDLAMRTERPTSEMIPELRNVLGQASPELRNAKITTMDQIVEDSYGSQRLAAHLLEFFGGSALVLCIAGLYGLLAYIVAQRTRELGVRIALGASRGRLLWLVMRQAGAMLLVGVAAGSALAFAAGWLVRGFLYGVGVHDGWTMALAALLLVVSGLTAAYLPARRAAGVDPMQALRTE